jgi:hypothetical protein
MPVIESNWPTVGLVVHGKRGPSEPQRLISTPIVFFQMALQLASFGKLTVDSIRGVNSTPNRTSRRSEGARLA